MSKIESLFPEQDKILSQYIFDEDKILKSKTFTQLKLDENTFAYGVLLPKEVEMTNKKGEVIGKEQIWSPVLITSDGNILEATKETELKYKLKFESIPSELPLKWSLTSIQDYLQGSDITPEIEPKELFERIRKKYEEFCFYKEKTWYKVNALWDAATYLFMLFDNFPIKENRGIQGTAKTKSMNISRSLSFNPTKILINPSEATLFRETHDKRVTKYIDEAEKLFTFKKGLMEADNRVELINGSYSKGSTIPRMEKIGNNFICVYYQVYSPTQISSINGLFGATETRAITQIHHRSLDQDPRGQRENDEYDENDQITRDYLHLFGLKFWKQVERNYHNYNLYENTKLKKRDLQIWKPLLAVAKVVGDDWFDEVLTFAEKSSLQKKEEFLTDDSWDYRILSIIKELLDLNVEVIRPKIIKERYNQKFVNDSERPPAEKSITNRLDNLGFKELKQPKDMVGVSYNINKENFFIIVSPLIPSLCNYSSYSSYSS